MRRGLLVGAVLGALLTLVGFIVSGHFAAKPPINEPEQRAYALFFQRPNQLTSRGLQEAFSRVEDPAPSQEPGKFLMKLVQECELRKFKTDIQFSDDPLDGAAVLYVDSDEFTDSQFSCLSERVRYPYVLFERVKQNCGVSGAHLSSVSDKVFGPSQICMTDSK